MPFTKHYLRILHSLIERICLVIRYVIYCICACITHISVTMVSFINNVMAVANSLNLMHATISTLAITMITISIINIIIITIIITIFIITIIIMTLALSIYLCTGLQSWHRYMDDTFVVPHFDENNFKKFHIDAVDPNIKFTKVNISDNRLSFLDCLGTIDTDRSLSVTVFLRLCFTGRTI